MLAKKLNRAAKVEVDKNEPQDDLTRIRTNYGHFTEKGPKFGSNPVTIASTNFSTGPKHPRAVFYPFRERRDFSGRPDA